MSDKPDPQRSHADADLEREIRQGRKFTLAEAIGRPPILGLTATAAPPVRAEIVERLGMRDPALVDRDLTLGYVTRTKSE